jgi:hypothetical protein
MASRKNPSSRSGQTSTAVGPHSPAERIGPLPVPDFDIDALTALTQEVFSCVGDVARNATALLKACESAKKVGIGVSLADSDFAHKVKAASHDLREAVDPCLASTKRLTDQLLQWERAEKNSRRSRFEQESRRRGWKVLGSWPEPVIEGIVFLVVDEEKNRVTLNGRALAGSPTAEKLVEAVRQELTLLTANRPAPAEFIKQLWKVYRAMGGQVDSGILAFDLLEKLVWQRQSKTFHRDPRSELFKGYSMAQFRADLTHYLASGAPNMSEGNSTFRLEIVGGSYAQDGMFMYFPQSDRLATCGRLIFRPVGAGEQQ